MTESLSSISEFPESKRIPVNPLKIDRKVCQAIRLARKKKSQCDSKWTQTYLGSLVGLSKTQISQIEMGRRFLTFGEAQLFASALNVSIVKILGDRL